MLPLCFQLGYHRLQSLFLLLRCGHECSGEPEEGIFNISHLGVDAADGLFDAPVVLRINPQIQRLLVSLNRQLRVI